MRYQVTINRKFGYVKTYTIIKRANDQSNAFSRFVQDLINKYVLKSGEKGNQV